MNNLGQSTVKITKISNFRSTLQFGRMTDGRLARRDERGEGVVKELVVGDVSCHVLVEAVHQLIDLVVREFDVAQLENGAELRERDEPFVGDVNLLEGTTQVLPVTLHLET